MAKNLAIILDEEMEACVCRLETMLGWTRKRLVESTIRRLEHDVILPLLNAAEREAYMAGALDFERLLAARAHSNSLPPVDLH